MEDDLAALVFGSSPLKELKARAHPPMHMKVQGVLRTFAEASALKCDADTVWNTILERWTHHQHQSGLFPSLDARLRAVEAGLSGCRYEVGAAKAEVAQCRGEVRQMRNEVAELRGIVEKALSARKVEVAQVLEMICPSDGGAPEDVDLDPEFLSRIFPPEGG